MYGKTGDTTGCQLSLCLQKTRGFVHFLTFPFVGH